MEAPSPIYHVAFLSLVINDVNEHVQPFTLPHIILSCGLRGHVSRSKNTPSPSNNIHLRLFLCRTHTYTCARTWQRASERVSWETMDACLLGMMADQNQTAEKRLCANSPESFAHVAAPAAAAAPPNFARARDRQVGSQNHRFISGHP